MVKTILFIAGVLCLGACASNRGNTGETEIAKWQYGKKGAVSITYDDGTINQFRVALPIMNELDLPATFFINTGLIKGSQYMGRFIGRPVEEIIEESVTEPANKDNFFERAMEYMYRYYPASRNRLPEPYLEELNRWNRADPGIPDKEYVQWQRGAYTSTPLQLMKSWVDTTAANDNVWLVLVFHGVDGIGWEALPGDMLKEYFEYIAANDDIWVATFGDAVRYMRQRMSSTVAVRHRFRRISVSLECSLDTEVYDIPLTLKTYVPDGWDEVQVKQENSIVKVTPLSGSEGSYVQYQAYPNAGTIEISKL